MNLSFIGDLTVDKYPDKGIVRLGGSSLNSAIWAKRLGATPSVLAAVGHDGAGKSFLRKMDEEGIASTLVKAMSGKTSAIEIFVDSDGERTYGAWDPGVLAHYHLGDTERVFLKGQHGVLLIIYGPTVHLLHEYIAIAKQKSASQVFAIDFGDFTQFHTDLSLVEEAGSAADVLFFGLTSATDGALIKTLQEYAERLPAAIVVTLAAEGSIAFVGNQTVKQKTKKVTVVDATGAGDAYGAGFLATYDKTNVQQAMKVGTQTAIQAITQLGAY